jgi:hypothetical protein
MGELVKLKGKDSTLCCERRMRQLQEGGETEESRRTSMRMPCNGRRSQRRRKRERKLADARNSLRGRCRSRREPTVEEKRGEISETERRRRTEANRASGGKQRTTGREKAEEQREGERCKWTNHRRNDQSSSNGEKNSGEDLELGVVEEGRRRLLSECLVVATAENEVNQRFVGTEKREKDRQVVSQDAQAEDGDGESVASPVRLAEREFGENLVLVLCGKRETGWVGGKEEEEDNGGRRAGQTDLA